MTVVAMLALDERDGAVLSAVGGIARRTGARVVLVHAGAGPGVEERLRAAGAAFGGAESRARAGEADAVAAAVLAETAADLLVIGRTASEDGAAAWGDHGRALLRAAGCPVLVVPGDAGALRFDRAVVGMDLSVAALDALALAHTLCDTVEALAILSPEDAHADPGALRAGLVARFEAALAERGLGPVPLRAVAGKSPADALLAAEADADLLAVGSRGLSPLATVFLGSTAERLAGKSGRPVLVVRRRGEARGLLGALFS